MQRLAGPFWMKVIVAVVEDLGPSTTSILLDSVEQTFVLVSRKWNLFRWRAFCGICFFCLDVGCRRWVVLRYRVSAGVEWKSGCLSYTVDSRSFEPALIRMIRLFEVRWRSPLICLPNSSKNTLGFSNFSYSNFQLFVAISITLGANYRLNHPQFFEFFIRRSSSENIDFLLLKHFLSSIYTLQAISSKDQYYPSAQRIKANRGSLIPFHLRS